jgi:MFS family permease
VKRELSGTAGMWAAGALLGLVFVGSTLPTALYDLYQSELDFSEITLTLIYSAYVAGTLATLLLFGRLSDQIGRRPAALAGIGLSASAMILFVVRIATPFLFAARFLTGLAIGIAAGASTAWISELDPEQNPERATSVAVGNNLLGLGVGPLLSGVLAQLAPFPLRLGYLVFLIALLPTAYFVARIRESVAHPVRRASDLSLRPRVGVPKEIRSRFLPPALTGFGIFALGGFYAALAPGMLRGPLRQTNRAVIGLVIFEFFVVGAAAIALTPRMRSRASMLAGLALLMPTLLLLVLAGRIHSLSLLIGTTALGGVALAFGYRGSLEVINQIAPRERRAEILSAYLLFSYAGVSLPVIGVGILSQLVNPELANLAFAVTIAAFGLVALVTGRKAREDGSATRATEGAMDS